MNKNLTWDELATIYDEHNSGRRARTLPMDYVANWAAKRKDLFIITKDDSFQLKKKVK